MKLTRQERHKVLPTTKDRTFRTFLLAMELEREQIVQRIARARDEAGLTQQEAADLLGVHKRTIENWEHVRVPWRDLNRVAEVYGKPLDWFLHGDAATERDEETVARLGRIEQAQERTTAELQEQAALLRELIARLDPVEPPRQRTAQ
jgi:transcriptional regulator with XRE-family HTH domain